MDAVHEVTWWVHLQNGLHRCRGSQCAKPSHTKDDTVCVGYWIWLDGSQLSWYPPGVDRHHWPYDHARLT